MRVVVCLLLALFSMSAHAHNGDHYSNNVLRVYTEEDFAPYTYLNESGNLEGIAIDIVLINMDKI